MTDAYGIIKALAVRAPQVRLEVLVNMVRSDAEGRSVFERVNRVTRTFLGRTLEYAGSVPTDPAVREAIRHRMPFALYAPDSPATAEVDRLARRLAGVDAVDGQPDPGFFARLATWFSGERLS